MKVICAWCETAISDEMDDDPVISHGICQDCAQRLANPNQEVREFLNSLPGPVFVVDQDGRVLIANQHAYDTVKRPMLEVDGFLGGEVIRCTNAHQPEGCGKSVHCVGCSIKDSINHTSRTGKSTQWVPAKIQVEGTKDEMNYLLSTEKVGNFILLRIEPKNNETEGSSS
jgi:hypothetical protein